MLSKIKEILKENFDEDEKLRNRISELELDLHRLKEEGISNVRLKSGYFITVTSAAVRRAVREDLKIRIKELQRAHRNLELTTLKEIYGIIQSSRRDLPELW